MIAAPRYDFEPESTETAPRRFRWTRDRYYKAAEVGLFGEGVKTELIEGEVVFKMSPQLTPHAVSVTLIQGYLEGFRHLGCVRTQLPVTIDEGNEPEPDASLVRGKPRDYLSEHPRATDVVLLVEVSDSTRRFDLGSKARLYARAGLAEYWVIDIPNRALVLHLGLGENGFANAVPFGEHESFVSSALGGVEVQVADLMP